MKTNQHKKGILLFGFLLLNMFITSNIRRLRFLASYTHLRACVGGVLQPKKYHTQIRPLSFVFDEVATDPSLRADGSKAQRIARGEGGGAAEVDLQTVCRYPSAAAKHTEREEGR